MIEMDREEIIGTKIMQKAGVGPERDHIQRTIIEEITEA